MFEKEFAILFAFKIGNRLFDWLRAVSYVEPQSKIAIFLVVKDVGWAGREGPFFLTLSRRRYRIRTAD